MLHTDKLELTVLITNLAAIDKQTAAKICTFEDLAAKITDHSSEEQATLIKRLVKNLIFKQFPHPEIDAIREAISNALDAHVRAGKENIPIYIKIQENRLKIKDQGDGMKSSSTIDFLTPGRSSNIRPTNIPSIETVLKEDELMEDVQKTQVTGRFGQGALAIFSLIYPSKISLPEFIEDNNSIKICINYYINEQPVEVTFEIQKESDFAAKISFRPLTELSKREISVHTKQENEEALLLKFVEKADKVFADIIPIAKKEDGTTIDITSDTIQEKREEICRSIPRVFKSVKTPIYLNGKIINEEIDSLQTIAMPGGSLRFTRIEEDNRSGSLRICEGGKLIMEFPLDQSLVPNEVTLDFDRLALTQERASFGYKDPQNILAIDSLIESIWTSNSLSLIEKGALLNALCPILDSQHFNLNKKVRELVATHAHPFFPDNTDLKALNDKDALYLNSKYFSSLPLEIFFEENNYQIYLIKTSSQKAVAVVPTKDKYAIFLNEDFFDTHHLENFQYNLYLLNTWLKNKEYPCSIQVKNIVRMLKLHNLKVEKKEEVTLLEPTIKDFSSYENMENANEILNLIDDMIDFNAQYAYPHDAVMQKGMRGYQNRLIDQEKELEHFRRDSIEEIHEQEIQYFLDRISPDALSSFEKYLKLSLAFKKSKKYAAYLYDLHVSNPEIFFLLNQYYNSDDIGILGDIMYGADKQLNVERFQIAIFHCYHAIVKREEDERKNYIAFLSKLSLWNKYPHISCEQMENIFCHLQEIMMIAHYQNPSKVLQFWTEAGAHIVNYRNLEANGKLEILKKIASQLPTNAVDKFIEYLPFLRYHNYLLTLSPQDIEKFLNAFFTDKIYFNLNPPFTQKDYQKILEISKRSDIPLHLIKKWTQIYYWGCKLDKDSIIPLNTEALFEMINICIQKNHFDESQLDVLIDVFKNFYQKINNFNNCCESLYVHSNQVLEKNSEQFAQIGNVQERLKHIATLLPEQCNLLPKSTLEQSLHLAFSLDQSFRNSKEYEEHNRELCREIWEKNEWISSDLRPFIYTLLLGKERNFVSENFKWPTALSQTESILLHEDPEVKKQFENSSELAAIRVERALEQNQIEYFFIQEFRKNSEEAGATYFKCEVHKDEEGNTIFVTKDDGKGMTLEDLLALRTPGDTTKVKEGDDPNYGWGFFTCFQDFDEVVISTSPDGLNHYTLYMQKTPHGIMRQIESEEGTYSKGTTISLKKSQSNPLVDLVKIKSKLISSCQYTTGLEIFFQDYLMNNSSQQTILQEEDTDDMSIQLGKGEDGIYCKETRMNSLDEIYLQPLPPVLREMLKEQDIKVRVFIPNSEQVMNRGHLIMKDFLLEKAQILIFKAASRYFQEQWLKENHFNKESHANFSKIFSDDYWIDFRYFNSQPDERLEPILKAVDEENWSLLNPTNKHLKDYLFQIANDFFRRELERTDVNVAFGASDSSIDVETFLSSILQKDEEKTKKRWLAMLRDQFADTTLFASFLTHLSTPYGMSFIDIRKQVKEGLIEAGLLLIDGEYNFNYIKEHSIEELDLQLQQKIYHVYAPYNQSIHPILKKFYASILSRIEAIKEQMTIDTVPIEKSSNFFILSHFIKEVAQHFLNKEIDVELYSQIDGCQAYTFPQSKTLYLNIANNNSIQFLKLYESYLKQELESLNEAQIQMIVEFLQTLAHELTHMDENEKCEGTHDTSFRNKLAEYLNSLYIRKNELQHSPLALLLLIFNERDNQTKTKRRKISSP